MVSTALRAPANPGRDRKSESVARLTSYEPYHTLRTVSDCPQSDEMPEATNQPRRRTVASWTTVAAVADACERVADGYRSEDQARAHSPRDPQPGELRPHRRDLCA